MLAAKLRRRPTHIKKLKWAPIKIDGIIEHYDLKEFFEINYRYDIWSDGFEKPLNVEDKWTKTDERDWRYMQKHGYKPPYMWPAGEERILGRICAREGILPIGKYQVD